MFFIPEHLGRFKQALIAFCESPLVLVCTPLPQELEHSDQADHWGGGGGGEEGQHPNVWDSTQYKIAKYIMTMQGVIVLFIFLLCILLNPTGRNASAGTLVGRINVPVRLFFRSPFSAWYALIRARYVY